MQAEYSTDVLGAAQFELAQSAERLLLLFEKASPTCATSQMFFMSTDATTSRMGVWPPGAGLQGQAPNHPMLLWLRAAVVSDGEKAASSRQVSDGKMSNRYQAGIRIPRRIRTSGIALRKLIRSRSVAAEPVSRTEKEQARSANPTLAAQASALVTHFESALG